MVFAKGTPFAVLARCGHGLSLEHNLILQIIPVCTQWLERASSDTTIRLLAEKQAFPNCIYYQTCWVSLFCIAINSAIGAQSSLCWPGQHLSVQVCSSLHSWEEAWIPSWPPLGATTRTPCLHHLGLPAVQIACSANCHREDTALEKEGTKWMWMPLRVHAMLLRPLTWGQVQIAALAAVKDPKNRKGPKGSSVTAWQVIWGMQGVSGIVNALSWMKLFTVSLQALGPGRKAQSTSAASLEAPAGQREASSHPLCTLGKT